MTVLVDQRYGRKMIVDCWPCQLFNNFSSRMRESRRRELQKRKKYDDSLRQEASFDTESQEETVIGQ